MRCLLIKVLVILRSESGPEKLLEHHAEHEAGKDLVAVEGAAPASVLIFIRTSFICWSVAVRFSAFSLRLEAITGGAAGGASALPLAPEGSGSPTVPPDAV